jgi:hypothetical protein
LNIFAVVEPNAKRGVEVETEDDEENEGLEGAAGEEGAAALKEAQSSDEDYEVLTAGMGAAGGGGGKEAQNLKVGGKEANDKYGGDSSEEDDESPQKHGIRGKKRRHLSAGAAAVQHLKTAAAKMTHGHYLARGLDEDGECEFRQAPCLVRGCKVSCSYFCQGCYAERIDRTIMPSNFAMCSLVRDDVPPCFSIMHHIQRNTNVDVKESRTGKVKKQKSEGK